MKCLVVGVVESHELNLISIIEGVSPNTIVDWYDGYLNEPVIEYARNNDYSAVIHGYTGEDVHFELARLNPDIMVFMPSDEYYGYLQQLVLTGSLPTIESYEFADDSHSSKSEACSFICGQLFKIAEELNISLQEARLRANITKTANGIINLYNAISYDGELKPSVGSINITYLGGTKIRLNLDHISDARIYEILITNHCLEISYLNELEVNFSDFEKRIVRYRGLFDHLISDWSEETAIFTLDKRRQLMGSKIFMFREGGVRRNEVEPDIPTEEGQIYVSEIVNGEMQMVKKGLGMDVFGSLFYDSGGPEGELKLFTNDFMDPSDWTALSGTPVNLQLIYPQGTFNNSQSLNQYTIIPLISFEFGNEIFINYKTGDNGTISFITIEFKDLSGNSIDFPDGDTIDFGFRIMKKNSSISSFKDAF